jgi:hypothetical protein
MSIGEMLDELIQHERDNWSAAMELSRALEGGAIILIFNDAPLRQSHLAGVTEYIRLAAARNEREIRLRLGWTADIMIHSRALRAQFELACGLVEQPAVVHFEPDVPMSRMDAVRSCIDAGMIPASTVTWDAFCEHVRDLADGWVDKKQGTIKRGFSQKQIERIVDEINRLINV